MLPHYNHMTPKKRILFFLFLLPLCISAQQTVRCSIYFETAKATLLPEARSMIEQLCDSLKVDEGYTISIEGYTDNVGDTTYNRRLSEQRADSVRRYMTTKGIAAEVFSTAYYGENRPVGDNSSDAGKQKNRRVDIVVRFEPDEPKGNIFDLYKQTVVLPAEFCIDPSRDTILRCPKGTIVNVKANTFKVPSGCRTNCVTLKVKEDFLKSEMILDNLTTTSNGAPLVSQGMVYTEANDCNGKKLNPLKGKDLVIMVPADTIVPATKIFQGNRGHDSILNWTVSNNSKLSGFSVAVLDECTDLLRCGKGCFRMYFFPRLTRAGLVFKGMVNREARSSNRDFRRCQRSLRQASREARKNGKPRIDSIVPPPASYSGDWSRCVTLKNLYDQYGVRDLNALMLAINKPLLDSFKVTTMDALKDTLRKIEQHKLEVDYVNKKISFEDFNYYIYNTPKLGWSNVDVFMKLDKSQLAEVRVALIPGTDTDCKIVFKNRRSIIPPEPLTGKKDKEYVFKNLPKNEPAWIVAIRYNGNQPMLCIKEIVIKDGMLVGVVPHKLSLEQLKAAVKSLDE